MTNTLQPFGVNMDPSQDRSTILSMQEFLPASPEITDTRVSKLGGGVLSAKDVNNIEPFGTAQGIAVPEPMETGNTGVGPTGSKGGGNYDDYET